MAEYPTLGATSVPGPQNGRRRAGRGQRTLGGSPGAESVRGGVGGGMKVGYMGPPGPSDTEGVAGREDELVRGASQCEDEVP